VPTASWQQFELPFGGGVQPAHCWSVVQAPHVSPPLLEPEVPPLLLPLPPPLLPPLLDPPLDPPLPEPDWTSLPATAASTIPSGPLVAPLQSISAPPMPRPATASTREAVVARTPGAL
jgi:hypothetical protein